MNSKTKKNWYTPKIHILGKNQIKTGTTPGSGAEYLIYCNGDVQLTYTYGIIFGANPQSYYMGTYTSSRVTQGQCS